MKEIKRIINHFLDDDLYKLTMCLAVLVNFPLAWVVYEFVDRSNRIYPKGFADELKRQIKMLEGVVITEQEIDFLKKMCYYLPDWFYNFLRGYRYNSSYVTVGQDAEGHLRVRFEGPWWHTILLEVKVLAIISELFYIMTKKNIAFDYEAYYKKSYQKAIKLLEAGCTFSDFGTRRRSSFDTQETAVRAFKDAYESRNWGALTGGKFVGTSNPYLAMKYNLVPVGTMAHEFVCGIAGMNGGPTNANRLAMEAWDRAYHGALGVYLYDSYGFNIFRLNITEAYANQFKGMRVDSGENFAQLEKIVKMYKDFGIDNKTKQVIFSNALDTERAIQIQNVAKNVCLPSFGIGTHFTNDWSEIADDIDPLNIVIKLVAIKENESWPFYNDTCKLSEDEGKHTGKPYVVRRFMTQLPQYFGELQKLMEAS